MTNHYDDMKVLPDPAKAEELRQRLHARMDPAAVDSDVPVVDVTEISESDTATPRDRTHRRPLVLAAAAVVVVIGVAGIAISDRTSDNADPALAVNAPPTGEEIRVTADAIQFGEGLVGSGLVATDDGRAYVVASHFDAADPHKNEPTLWWFRPKASVLVGFDADGNEQWRTELHEPPAQVVAADGDVWLSYGDGTLSRIDASDGRVVDQLNVGQHASMIGAFGSVWVQSGKSSGRAQLVRINPDLSTATVALPDRVLNGDYNPPDVDPAKAGPDAIWVPLGEGGVATVDPVTLKVTVIPADDIGHEVKQIAFDGDAAYVANDFRVTSIVDGNVDATILASGHDAVRGYLGSVDGVFGFGELRGGALFRVLRPNDPMVIAERKSSVEGEMQSVYEIDGNAWMETGRNFNLRRVELVPVSANDG